jgi:hypothetical protein
MTLDQTLDQSLPQTPPRWYPYESVERWQHECAPASANAEGPGYTYEL